MVESVNETMGSFHWIVQPWQEISLLCDVDGFSSYLPIGSFWLSAGIKHDRRLLALDGAPHARVEISNSLLKRTAERSERNTTMSGTNGSAVEIRMYESRTSLTRHLGIFMRANTPT